MLYRAKKGFIYKNRQGRESRAVPGQIIDLKWRSEELRLRGDGAIEDPERPDEIVVNDKMMRKINTKRKAGKK